MLSERAKELIVKARIVSFDRWKADYPDAAIEIFQGADDRREYLSQAELDMLRSMSPETSALTDVAETLREQAATIVDGARERVLAAYPGITEPGGALYPAMRAEACWRDLWHFLRCVTYGVAGDRQDYISDLGLEHMGLLYEELQVPLDAMICGIENLKVCGLPLFDRDLQTAIEPYFDYLTAAMQRLE